MKNIQLLFITLFCLISVTAGATMVVQVPIDKVANDAQDSFCGVCRSRDVVTNPNEFGEKVTYTFEAQDVMKGDHKAGDTIKFTQFEGFKGKISFVVDREYCIMLNKESSAGFRSPVGLSNGVYNVSRNKDGNKLIRASLSRSELTKDIYSRNPSLSKSLSKSERVLVDDTEKKNMNYEDFISLVRKLSVPQAAK